VDCFSAFPGSSGTMKPIGQFEENAVPQVQVPGVHHPKRRLQGHLGAAASKAATSSASHASITPSELTNPL
jgi:hypothetical protein